MSPKNRFGPFLHFFGRVASGNTTKMQKFGRFSINKSSIVIDIAAVLLYNIIEYSRIVS